ncbi:MAG: hypothetical protein BWX92_04086 [Deltaproteobacteria bacterium ADurb.Bin135]|nr:MAG: hypothetical protein BWX92_04086 [Deltaproteobacteria bacterium ADurb.Bin135]
MSDLGNVLSTIFGGLSGLLLSKRENGGRVRKGKPYLVGENGAELIVPDLDGTVFPLHKMLGKDSEDKKSKKGKKSKNFLYDKLDLTF